MVEFMNRHAHDARHETLIDPVLLDLLLRAEGPTSVEALALQRGVGREAVLSELDRLRGVGCAFDEHPQHGVRLREAGLGAWADYLHHALGRERLIEVYQRTGSTQDACRRLLSTCGSRGEGALVTTHDQTAGRGRFGRKWSGLPGRTLAFTRACLIERTGGDSAVDRLTFAASVAVAAAVETLLSPTVPGRPRVQIKWPNDLCIEGRKLAGILVETCEIAPDTRAAMLGVGLNVSLQPADMASHDPALADRLTSLAMHGSPVDRLLVLARVVRALDEVLEHTEPTALLDQWRSRCTQLEQPVRVRCDGRLIEGRVIDVDPHEGLILRATSGELVHLPAAKTTVE